MARNTVSTFEFLDPVPKLLVGLLESISLIPSKIDQIVDTTSLMHLRPNTKATGYRDSWLHLSIAAYAFGGVNDFRKSCTLSCNNPSFPDSLRSMRGETGTGFKLEDWPRRSAPEVEAFLRGESAGSLLKSMGIGSDLRRSIDAGGGSKEFGVGDCERWRGEAGRVFMTDNLSTTSPKAHWLGSWRLPALGDDGWERARGLPGRLPDAQLSVGFRSEFVRLFLRGMAGNFSEVVSRPACASGRFFANCNSSLGEMLLKAGAVRRLWFRYAAGGTNGLSGSVLSASSSPTVPSWEEPSAEATSPSMTIVGRLSKWGLRGGFGARCVVAGRLESAAEEALIRNPGIFGRPNTGDPGGVFIVGASSSSLWIEFRHLRQSYFTSRAVSPSRNMFLRSFALMLFSLAWRSLSANFSFFKTVVITLEFRFESLLLRAPLEDILAFRKMSRSGLVNSAQHRGGSNPKSP